jgi:hypothetical protein
VTMSTACGIMLLLEGFRALAQPGAAVTFTSGRFDCALSSSGCPPSRMHA